MSEPRQTFQFRVPRDFSEDQRIRAGRLAIEKIRQRTASGRDLNGRAFDKYSDSYKESEDFKIAGKSSIVNLKQTGDMLDSLDIIGQGIGFVLIGYEEGTLSNDKAAWAKASDNGASREFLGLNDGEIEGIILEVKQDNLETNIRGLLRQASTGQDNTTTTTLGEFLRNLRING